MVAAAVRSASPRSALDEDAVVDQEAPQDVAGGHRLPSLEALLGHELRNRFVHGLAGLDAGELVAGGLLAEETASHELVRGTARERAELCQQSEPAVLLLRMLFPVSGTVEPAPGRFRRCDISHGSLTTLSST